VEHGLR